MPGCGRRHRANSVDVLLETRTPAARYGARVHRCFPGCAVLVPCALASRARRGAAAIRPRRAQLSDPGCLVRPAPPARRDRNHRSGLRPDTLDVGFCGDARPVALVRDAGRMPVGRRLLSFVYVLFALVIAGFALFFAHAEGHLHERGAALRARRRRRHVGRARGFLGVGVKLLQMEVTMVGPLIYLEALQEVGTLSQIVTAWINFIFGD